MKPGEINNKWLGHVVSWAIGYTRVRPENHENERRGEKSLILGSFPDCHRKLGARHKNSHRLARRPKRKIRFWFFLHENVKEDVLMSLKQELVSWGIDFPFLRDWYWLDEAQPWNLFLPYPPPTIDLSRQSFHFASKFFCAPFLNKKVKQACLLNSENKVPKHNAPIDQIIVNVQVKYKTSNKAQRNARSFP